MISGVFSSQKPAAPAWENTGAITNSNAGSITVDGSGNPTIIQNNIITQSPQEPLSAWNADELSSAGNIDPEIEEQINQHVEYTEICRIAGTPEKIAEANDEYSQALAIMNANNIRNNGQYSATYTETGQLELALNILNKLQDVLLENDEVSNYFLALLPSKSHE